METKTENTNLLEINFPKEAITEKDIELVKEYIKEKKNPCSLHTK